jgi:hypothetical protein
MLLCASSPYARRGALYEAFRKHFGRDDAPVLIWKASTLTMNPSVQQLVIDEAYERDPAKAAAEHGAEFRTDIENFVSSEVVEACITPDRFELPPIGGVIYSGFVDPSGGSADSMTLAISHRDGEKVVLDVVREIKPPFAPDQVVSEFAALLKNYRISRVTSFGNFYDRRSCFRVRTQFSDIRFSVLPTHDFLSCRLCHVKLLFCEGPF